MAEGGSVAVAADVGDSAGMCWRRRWEGGKEVKGWEGRGGVDSRAWEEPVAHGPGAYVHAGIAWPLRRLGSAYLPTLNLCQPTITGYPSFHPLACLLARLSLSLSLSLRLYAKFTRLA